MDYWDTDVYRYYSDSSYARPRKIVDNLKLDWLDVSGSYYSPEVVFFTKADIQELSGWSEDEVRLLFFDRRFPSCKPRAFLHFRGSIITVIIKRIITIKVSDYLEDNLRKLAQGEMDFLLCMDEKNAFPDFVTFAKKPEPAIFVTYPSNPILKKRKKNLQDIITSDFIVTDREIGYSRLLKRQLQKQDTSALLHFCCILKGNNIYLIEQ